MLAELESRVERTVPISRIAPATTPKSLCSTCLRPYHKIAEVEYYCDACGAAHFVNEFYICCPVDAERPL